MDRDDRAALQELGRGVATFIGGLLAGALLLVLITVGAIAVGALVGLAYRAFLATCGC